MRVRDRADQHADVVEEDKRRQLAPLYGTCETFMPVR